MFTDYVKGDMVKQEDKDEGVHEYKKNREDIYEDANDVELHVKDDQTLSRCTHTPVDDM